MIWVSTLGKNEMSKYKRPDIKCRITYMVVDMRNNEEPLCVGNIHEVSAFSGISERNILSAISHAKRRGTRCRFVRFDFNDDEVWDGEEISGE